MAKIVLTDAWLRANARHKRADVLTMSELVAQNLTVQIAKTGRTNFLWRGRSEGKIQTIKLGSHPPHDALLHVESAGDQAYRRSDHQPQRRQKPGSMRPMTCANISTKGLTR